MIGFGTKMMLFDVLFGFFNFFFLIYQLSNVE